MMKVYRELCIGLLMLLFIPWSLASEEEEFKLPSYIKVCYRDDPNVASCLKNNIETLMPIFKSGAKEFDLQPLDPFGQHNLTVNFKSPILGGKLDVPHIYLYGLSNLMVLNVRPKLNIPDKFELGIDVHFPMLNSKANYFLSGNVVRIPVNMRGNVDMNLEDVNVTFHIIGDVKTINNYDYLLLRSFSWNLKGEGLRNVYIKNNDVVLGKPALNTLTKNLVNSSWRQLKVHFLPAILQETKSIYKNVFFEFFKRYPYDVLFPRRTRTSSIHQ